MFLLLFPRQTFVCCTIIVKRKYSSYTHRTYQVANLLPTKLYVTPTTGTLSCSLNHFKKIVLTLSATTGKTRSIGTITKHVRPVVTEALPWQYLYEYQDSQYKQILRECWSWPIADKVREITNYSFFVPWINFYLFLIFQS